MQARRQNLFGKWRIVDGDGVDVKPGKMSGPHFFIEPGGSVAMSSTTALHAVNE